MNSNGLHHAEVEADDAQTFGLGSSPRSSVFVTGETSIHEEDRLNIGGANGIHTNHVQARFGRGDNSCTGRHGLKQLQPSAGRSRSSPSRRACTDLLRRFRPDRWVGTFDQKVVLRPPSTASPRPRRSGWDFWPEIDVDQFQGPSWRHFLKTAFRQGLCVDDSRRDVCNRGCDP